MEACILPVLSHARFVALADRCTRPNWNPASVDRLGYIHTSRHVKNVEQFAAEGGGRIEQDTIVSQRSFEVARLAVGAVCDAVERIVSSEDTTAFCIVRPPGHHAMPDHPMGFCLFNSVAVAARVAQREFGIDRVLIVDFDVHHGNGTQAAFYDDASVGFFSMHRSPFYPGTGAADETGFGDGRGTTLNLPIAFGTSRSQQLSDFRRELEHFARRIEPQLVLLSAGFDSHKDDPIGSLGLESEDFATLTRVVLEVADTHANGRVISTLEGGYNPQAMTECIEIHVDQLLEPH